MAGRLTVKGVADKLREFQGNQAAVARAFGVDRSRITQYMAAHPELAAVKQEAEEAILDHAESALYRAVLQGELSAVKWLLATKGKGRGYVERQEVTGSDGGPVQVRHQVDLTELTDDELAFLESIAIRAVRPSGDSSGAGAA